MDQNPNKIVLVSMENDNSVPSHYRRTGWSFWTSVFDGLTAWRRLYPTADEPLSSSRYQGEGLHGDWYMVGQNLYHAMKKHDERSDAA